MGRLLVIVGREDLARREQLNDLFAGEPVDVVVDRRWSERRQRQAPRAGERRLGDRRASIRSEARMPITRDLDMVSARRRGRALAAAAALPSSDAALVATAVSSLARNIVSYAERGELRFRVIENKDAQGIEVVAVSAGPGRLGAGRVFENGHPTSGRLHQWLAGVQHLKDEFHITCELATGTPIAIRRWRR